jgi:hypothetical protein
MSLRDYQRKRNFERAAEPKGKRGSTAGHSFVIQKHAARLRSQKIDPREDNALAITTDGRKLALDARMAIALRAHDGHLTAFSFRCSPKIQLGQV